MGNQNRAGIGYYVVNPNSGKVDLQGLAGVANTDLTYAAVGKAARTATLEKNATLTFNSGTVDFRPERKLVPGDAPNAFPPKNATPGSVGDADYSPLVLIENAGGHIYKTAYQGFYSTKEETFLTAKDRRPDGTFDPAYGEVVALEEENYFFTREPERRRRPSPHQSGSSSSSWAPSGSSGRRDEITER